MDRNMRSSYVNSGPRSLPHMNNKRHAPSNSSHCLSPPTPTPPSHTHNMTNAHNHSYTSQHDDIIQYIYESWNKVTRDLERGNEDARYYCDLSPPRNLANFRPFNLEDWWARRLVQASYNRKHRS